MFPRAGKWGEQSIRPLGCVTLGSAVPSLGLGDPRGPSSPAEFGQVGFVSETAVSSQQKPSTMLLLGFFSTFSF